MKAGSIRPHCSLEVVGIWKGNRYAGFSSRNFFSPLPAHRTWQKHPVAAGQEPGDGPDSSIDSYRPGGQVLPLQEVVGIWQQKISGNLHIRTRPLRPCGAPPLKGEDLSEPPGSTPSNGWWCLGERTLPGTGGCWHLEEEPSAAVPLPEKNKKPLPGPIVRVHSHDSGREGVWGWAKISLVMVGMCVTPVKLAEE